MTGGGRNATNRMAAYALLRNKKTGKRFWTVSTHLQPFPNQSPRLAAIQRHQFENLQDMYQEFNKSAPVVMVGDFNQDLLQNPGFIPNGMKSNFKNRSLGGTHGRGNKIIDYILYGAGIDVAGNSIIRKGMASDHHAVIANLRIPGMRDGGFTLNDGIARLHKKETVLTAPLSEKLNQGIERFADGDDNNYNLYMTVNGAKMNEDQLAEYTMRKIRRAQSRRATPRRTVG
jgi:hypothetical protein